MVAAPGAEGVEILALDSKALEITLRRTVLGYRSGGRDVISGDGITQQGKRPRICDRADGRNLGGELGKKAGLSNVARFGIPFVDFPAGDGDRVPLLVTIEDVTVLLLEKIGGKRRLQDISDLFLLRPDVAQVDGLPLSVLTKGLLDEIDIHSAGDRVGDHQRR